MSDILNDDLCNIGHRVRDQTYVTANPVEELLNSTPTGSISF